MRFASRMSLVLITLSASNGAFAQNPQTLPDVVVTATTLDGASVMIPFFLMQTMYVQLKHDVATIDADEYSTSLTKAQVCSKLKASQPSGCTTSNYPAAPGIPSASGALWAGNGCGADPWGSAAGTAYLDLMLPGIFSGDLNKPVKGNPSIDFTAICNDHDRGYTSTLSQQIVDSQFSKGLSRFCNGSTSPQLCNGFALTYVDTVKKYGAAAYADDQAQLKCAAWGSSMKSNGCKS